MVRVFFPLCTLWQNSDFFPHPFFSLCRKLDSENGSETFRNTKIAFDFGEDNGVNVVKCWKDIGIKNYITNNLSLTFFQSCCVRERKKIHLWRCYFIALFKCFTSMMLHSKWEKFYIRWKLTLLLHLFIYEYSCHFKRLFIEHFSGLSTLHLHTW